MKQDGFTLIETIVYLALFALIIGGFVVATYMLFETYDRNQTKAMMQEEENFLIGKINWALNGAKIVSLPTPSSLTITKYDASTLAITLLGTDMELDGKTLNNSNVKIQKLVFIHTYAGGPSPDSLEAGFLITATMPTGGTISEIASTTRYLRK